jgi:hypothetical protein
MALISFQTDLSGLFRFWKACTRFNLAPDEPSGRFEEKFKRQLAARSGCDDATMQLAAEVRWHTHEAQRGLT